MTGGFLRGWVLRGGFLLCGGRLLGSRLWGGGLGLRLGLGLGLRRGWLGLLRFWRWQVWQCQGAAARPGFQLLDVRNMAPGSAGLTLGFVFWGGRPGCHRIVCLIWQC
jgi:hypothetical protein